MNDMKYFPSAIGPALLYESLPDTTAAVNKEVRMRPALVIFALAFSLVSVRDGIAQEEPGTYRVLATSKTSTMQKEMQEAGEAGFRFVAVMGGETAIGGKEVVVLMEKLKGEQAKYQYRLLATSKTSTLQKELQEAADAGWEAIGQTVFESLMGGKETAAILQKTGDASTRVRYEYKLLATSKTSTLEKEIREVAEQGYRPVAMTVGKTALGGSELVVVTRRVAR